jgi:GAF domain-containing protein
VPRTPEPKSPRVLDATAATLVEIVGTLVRDFDVIEVLTALTGQSVELLDAAAAGILLADSDGQLCVIGASTEQVNMLELFQIQNDEGPCFDCFHAGEAVNIGDLRESDRWPRFTVESIAAGFPSVCALPLRLHGVTLGCLNLFMTEPGQLSATDVSIGQALADVASIAMIQGQASEAEIYRIALERTFHGRIAIEQARGMIAETLGIDVEDAFLRLRAFAKKDGRGLTATARSIVDGTLDIDFIAT